MMNREWADAITTRLEQLALHPDTEWMLYLPNRYKQLLFELIEAIDPRKSSPRTQWLLHVTDPFLLEEPPVLVSTARPPFHNTYAPETTLQDLLRANKKIVAMKKT